MKKRFFSLILFFVIFGLFYFQYEKQRFYISSPMEDYEYKKAIISDSKNITYKLENLRPLVGPIELENFIKQNDKNPQIYTPSKENIQNGIYRANLHMHSTNSDGEASVEYILDQAQMYSKEKLNGKYFYLAITDHNTVLGAKEIIKVLQKNPNKYKNIKIVAGIEINSTYETKYSENPIEIHILAWGINPYDNFLNKEFYKKDLKNKWNRKQVDPEFQEVIDYMSKRSTVGIAHPARYLSKVEDKEGYIKELFKDYKLKNKKGVSFLEGYYQSYPTIIKSIDNQFKEFLIFINKEANVFNVIRTGSTDVHGYSIFKK